METRWMKRKNENGEIEKFYPITHAKAIVYSDDDKAIFNDIKAHLAETANWLWTPTATSGTVLIEKRLFIHGESLSMDYDFGGDPFVIGDTLIVEYDGVPYTCQVTGKDRFKYIGNKSIATSDENTGEPFIIFTVYDTINAQFEDGNNHELKVVNPNDGINYNILPIEFIDPWLAEVYDGSVSYTDYALDNALAGVSVTLESMGVTATADELNYVDGVTSNIQTQFNDVTARLSDLETVANALAQI